MELYTQILEHAGPTFQFIIQHIIGHTTEGCLFHCTGIKLSCIFRNFSDLSPAGKDRTGILAAILLKVYFATTVSALS
jgi:hypothetical protein